MLSIMDVNWSRRGLLTAMSAAALGRAEAVKLPRKVTLGIIGYDGHLSEIVGRLADFPDIELAAVADANSDPQATGAAFRNPAVARARRYRDYPEMLSRERLDCAAICNQNGGRAAAIVACAEHKLAVIAEKPMAISRREFEAVVAAVEGNRVHAGMLLPMRFDPPYLAMKQIVDSGEIGELAQIDAQKSYQLDNRPEWQKHAKTYGSTILWIGIHMIDLMAFTSGRGFTQAASFQGHVAFPELGDMQNATATIFRLDNGGTATLRLDYLRPAAVQRHGDDRLRLAGTRGVVEYRDDSGVTVLGPRGQRTVTSLPPRGSVFADFVQSAYAGARSALPWRDIRRVNEWAIAAQEAADTSVPTRAFPPQPAR
jgi:predicted dehydrogenase